MLVFATNGRFYTLDAAKLPGGRGHGEPVRLLIDIEQDADLVAVFRHQGGRKLLVGERAGPRLRRAGGRVPRQYPQGQAGAERQAAGRGAARLRVVEGELVAAIGENRKMLIFPLEQVPEMARGRGVRLQRYKDGGLSDVKTFKAEDGLTWIDAGGRVFTLSLKELADWRGNRARRRPGAAGPFPRPTSSSAGCRRTANRRREIARLRLACSAASRTDERSARFPGSRSRCRRRTASRRAGAHPHHDQVVLALGLLLRGWPRRGDVVNRHRGLGARRRRVRRAPRCP